MCRLGGFIPKCFDGSSWLEERHQSHTCCPRIILAVCGRKPVAFTSVNTMGPRWRPRVTKNWEKKKKISRHVLIHQEWPCLSFFLWSDRQRTLLCHNKLEWCFIFRVSAGEALMWLEYDGLWTAACVKLYSQMANDGGSVYKMSCKFLEKFAFGIYSFFVFLCISLSTFSVIEMPAKYLKCRSIVNMHIPLQTEVCLSVVVSSFPVTNQRKPLKSWERDGAHKSHR